jgi:hypothetical protein
MTSLASRLVLTKHPDIKLSLWSGKILLDLAAELPIDVTCLSKAFFPEEELTPTIARPSDASTAAYRDAIKL